MPRSERYQVERGEERAPEPTRTTSETKMNASFLIILASLLFVAVFGGALIGGVVSGDPSDGFFITILAASGVAIGIAALVALRIWLKKRAANRAPVTEEVAKEATTSTVDIRGTLTRTLDEDEELGHYDSRGRFHHPRQGPVEEEIEEVEAQSMAPGDVSAMSPGTYDYDTYYTKQSQYTRSEYGGNGYGIHNSHQESDDHYHGPFDFDSVRSEQPSLPRREDPPEEGEGCNLVCGMPVSKDPKAAIMAADGRFVPEEASVMSRYDVEEDMTADGDKVSSLLMKRSHDSQNRF